MNETEQDATLRDHETRIVRLETKQQYAEAAAARVPTLWIMAVSAATGIIGMLVSWVLQWRTP
jgi:hypothetical protein